MKEINSFYISMRKLRWIRWRPVGEKAARLKILLGILSIYKLLLNWIVYSGVHGILGSILEHVVPIYSIIYDLIYKICICYL